jgi:threonyl-tRNA synthetase
MVARPESGSLGARIRAGRVVPYQPVIGAREAADGQAALRLRDGRRIPARPTGEVLARIGERVAAHDTQLWEEAATAV